MKYHAATPYVAVIVIFRKDGKIAFVLRQNTDWMNGYYGLPGGKVDSGESITQAAIREAKEETGVTILPKDLTHLLVAHRHDADSDWIDNIFEAHTWQGELHNAEPDKHASLDWLDPNNLPNNIIPVLKFFLEQVAAGHHYTEYGWKTSP